MRRALPALWLTVSACASAGPVPRPVPGGGYAAFAHFGTNPVIDATEEASVRVGLAADRASCRLVRHYLERGALPPPEAVRVEDCVAAIAPAPRALPGAAPQAALSVSTTLAPSPFRPGWDVLVVTIAAPDRPSPLVGAELAVVSDEPTGALERALAAGGARVLAGELTSLGSALQAAERVLFIGDGAGLGGPDAQGALLETAASARAAGGVLSVVGRVRPGLDDALLERLARAGGGTYDLVGPGDAADAGAIADRLARAPGLTGATATLRFDPLRVARWRLVGHEGRALRPGDAGRALAGGAIPVGDAVDLVVEVERRPGDGPLGRVRVTAAEGTLDVALVGAALDAAASPAVAERHRAIVAIAAFAEKLRGSYWMKTLAWEVLAAEVARLEPAALRADVADLVAKARALWVGALGSELPVTTRRWLP